MADIPGNGNSIWRQIALPLISCIIGYLVSMLVNPEKAIEAGRPWTEGERARFKLMADYVDSSLYYGRANYALLLQIRDRQLNGKR